jgi:hypothetical protein
MEGFLRTHSEHGQHFQCVFVPLAVGQIETTCVQNGAVELKINSMLKTIFSLWNDKFMSRGLQRGGVKIGKFVTLHYRELLKKRPILRTVCSQSVIQGLEIGDQLETC